MLGLDLGLKTNFGLPAPSTPTDGDDWDGDDGEGGDRCSEGSLGVRGGRALVWRVGVAGDKVLFERSELLS